MMYEIKFSEFIFFILMSWSSQKTIKNTKSASKVSNF